MGVNWRIVFDVARGAVVGLLLCDAVIKIIGVDPESLIFRYAGY